MEAILTESTTQSILPTGPTPETSPPTVAAGVPLTSDAASANAELVDAPLHMQKLKARLNHLVSNAIYCSAMFVLITRTQDELAGVAAVAVARGGRALAWCVPIYVMFKTILARVSSVCSFFFH